MKWLLNQETKKFSHCLRLCPNKSSYTYSILDGERKPFPRWTEGEHVPDRRRELMSWIDGLPWYTGQVNKRNKAY